MSAATGAVPGHDADRILRERALQLARPSGEAAAPCESDAVHVLEFTVAGRRCALALAWLKEVRAVKDLTALPFAAPHVVGVVNVRGRVVPVLDLAFFLGFKADRAAAINIIAVGGTTIEAAFAAQEIGPVGWVSSADIQRRSVAMKGLQPELVQGTTASGLLMIDGQELMALTRGGWAPDPGPAAN
jgi:purine-binding chemotaxis protein CheW